MKDPLVAADAEISAVIERTFDASDPEQVNTARKRAGRTKKAKLEFIHTMMQMPEGRKWLWEIMESCSVFGNPIVQNDPYSTYFNLGQQNVGKRILADVQQFPELYATMCKENK